MIRLRVIDAELASIDVAIGALREAISRQGDIERQVHLEARADQRDEAMERARVLVTAMFDCGRSLDPFVADSARSAPIVPPSEWNPGIAGVLSFLIPGLGQIYKSQRKGRGLRKRCA